VDGSEIAGTAHIILDDGTWFSLPAAAP
jgi:hypothetical protein